MEKDFIIIIVIGILLTVVILGLVLFKGKDQEVSLPFFNILEGQEEQAKTIREPAAAGSFYLASAEELKIQINEFLDKASPPEAEGEVLGLILPHAGYEFSGQVAAHGFKKLIGEDVDTVILIGNSHHQKFEGASIYPQGYYKTPLGQVEIDSILAEKITQESERIFFKESAHQKEHSLEVEIPFLQMVLDDFKIVPIIWGNSDNPDYEILVQAIVKHIQSKNVLLIASSDLSHYPDYEAAQKADSKTIEAILTGDVSILEKTIQDLEKQEIPNAATWACAIDAIKTIMLVAEELGAKEIRLLNQANSGDVSIGDKSRVVGYAAIGFFGERRGKLLNEQEKEQLLTIAQQSVESYVREKTVPQIESSSSFLNEKQGAFVTLKKHNSLRGCIGSFEPDVPLYQVVSQMAIAAATQDMRFSPITLDELGDLEYEISVLSPLQRISDWQEIEVGKHGVQIKQGFKSGVFLPQVATDNNWSLGEFMGELCTQKVGLPRNCWQQENIELYTFTAQVFEAE